MSETMITRDFYVRYTSCEGRTHVAVHRVWDADRFIRARMSDAAAANAKAQRDDADAPALATATAITRAQFIAAGGRAFS